ncbi:hypothetical protein [Actinoplanes aureus]|uniref:Uncharacterized protein n=1 Tax=Actinoplanes aureus TaxID=2792083 RepID=A0A931CB12_9ACTN|nr:hypothetical protein [Actinoplanes aureus]MBG0561580.1 hypothetical protein [Actinoplanes aureus]
MTTEANPPQDQSREANEPNEFGFAGEGTAPQPEPIGAVDGESIAVPAGDLTGAITEAIEELSDHDEDHEAHDDK